MPRLKLTDRFEDIFDRLLARETLETHENELSGMFEAIAANLLGGYPGRSGCYFDGVVGMTLIMGPPRKIELRGEMWVGRDQSQWTEPFSTTVVDKRSTKQGIWITISIGEDRAEGELTAALRQSGGPE
jgi:hypothetical protein